MTTWLPFSDLDVFGSELDFIHPTTQECLQDRVRDALQDNQHFTLVIRECVETFQSKEEFEECAYRDYPKAVKVPASETGTIPPSAFLAVPRLRHVIVEEGMHTVGALAWQNCRQLRIVKLPNTVVRIDESAFCGPLLFTTRNTDHATPPLPPNQTDEQQKADQQKTPSMPNAHHYTMPEQLDHNAG